uniref:Scinderin like a n=1 Tax=Cyclopterus lumpus TaxID=8103 RepID=A0A8C2ZJ57_CYCLU
MAFHKEFQTAGKKPGLQVWRIEKMDLALVPPELHGDFYTGDSYIVLKTTPAPSYNIHSWLGEKATQDERGCAAIFMTQLDTFLNGAPIQFTEFQNQESLTFLGYFRTGIKYKMGGVASGFRHVVTNEADVERLLRVKGRRRIRAIEMEMSWESFNKGDCFIIDLGAFIYHWSGSESNMFERLKTTELAVAIRDNERQGRAEVEMIEEGSEPEDVLGPKPDLPPGGSDSDQHTDKQNKNLASLYLISDAAGSMTSTMVADKNPFKQDMLSNSECYILDNGGSNKIFVWKGIMPRYMSISATSSYPDTARGGRDHPFQAVLLQLVGQGREHRAEQGLRHGSHCQRDIWRVEGGDKVPVDPSTYGQFYGGDCYLVLYSYNAGGREKHIIYTWQGNKCTKDELAASAFLTVQLDDSMGGAATQIRVTQGQEPPHLVSVFKANPLLVHLGGTSRVSGESKPGSKRLFHIRRSSTKATRAVEVAPTATSLNTNDVFVLKTPSSLFVWKGKGAMEEEQAAAEYVCKIFPVENCFSLSADFWKALGGKKDYQTSLALQKTVKPPRLFGCSNKTGRLIAEEVPGEFTQMDLAPDDVMILDTWNQIYVWVGNDANETEKTGSSQIAEQYVESDPSGRTGVPIGTIKQGNEPLFFTGWFLAWDPDMWDQDLLKSIKERISKH